MAYLDYATTAYQGLMVEYGWDNGQWNGCMFWQSANALTAVISYSRWASVGNLEDLIWNTFSKLQGPSGNFAYPPHEGWAAWLADHVADKQLDRQTVYDDEAWWALAWLAAHDVTVDPAKKNTYLQEAQHIHRNMTSAWSWPCGGGLWWNTPKFYDDNPRQDINAIENELFLDLSAKLFLATSDPIYLSWARATLNWFERIFLDQTANGLILDGISSQCGAQGKAWTYNQGVILGGLADMFKITNNPSYLNRAFSIFQAVKANMTDAANNVLRESGDPDATADDHRQFKGIFMRNLSSLFDVETDPSHMALYRQFFADNADSIWRNDRSVALDISRSPSPWIAFGYRWEGPFDSWDASRQSSALDALIAAIRLDDYFVGHGRGTVESS